MGKTLKSSDVINSIAKKVQLKKDLRIAKKEGDEKLVKDLSHKISKIETKLSSTPLSKS